MQKTAIQATSNSDRIEYGTAEIHSFSPQAVLAKSLKMLALFWGIALLSVFLPVVHFVLVPLFFILGMVFAFRARKLRFEIVSGEVLCPNCKAQVTIKNASCAVDHKDICQSCASVIKIAPVPEAHETGQDINL